MAEPETPDIPSGLLILLDKIDALRAEIDQATQRGEERLVEDLWRQVLDLAEQVDRESVHVRRT